MPKVGDSLKVNDAKDFKCGFCGANCSLSLEHEMLLHAEPMCQQFEQLEPDAFLVASRLEHAKRGNDTNGETLLS